MHKHRRCFNCFIALSGYLARSDSLECPNHFKFCYQTINKLSNSLSVVIEQTGRIIMAVACDPSCRLCEVIASIWHVKLSVDVHVIYF